MIVGLNSRQNLNKISVISDKALIKAETIYKQYLLLVVNRTRLKDEICKAQSHNIKRDIKKRRDFDQK